MNEVNVFISYSHKDEVWCDRLTRTLDSMKYSKLGIENLRRGELAARFGYKPWSDKEIPIGKRWRREIDEAMGSARVAVLIVSSDFLASEFVLEHEVPPLFDRESKGELSVFALIVRPCIWEQTQWLNEFQVYPNKRPLSALSEHEFEERLLEFVPRIYEQLEGEMSSTEVEEGIGAEAAFATVSQARGAKTQLPAPILTAGPASASGPREESRPDGTFYTWLGIQEMIRKSIPADESIEKGLLIFRTKKQRTWLVATTSRLFCVLDGEKTRARDRLIQWREPRGEITTINARERSSSKLTGLVDIGTHRNWLYSKRLHPDPDRLVELVRDLATF